MTFRYMPYYMTNKDWYYFDPRDYRTKLTDKATQKALESYLEDERQNERNYRLTYDELVLRAKKDIERYIKNKHRYTIKEVERRGPTLVAIDGEPTEKETENWANEWLAKMSGEVELSDDDP